MEPVEITAGRLHLRPWQAGDEPVLREAGADLVALPSGLPSALSGWASGEELSWAACDSTTSEVLAAVVLRACADQGMWDVAAWCRPAARGQGVVPDAVGVVCRWAFAELEAAEVHCRGAAGDRAARRAAEKAGFRPVPRGTAPSGMVLFAHAPPAAP